MDDTRLHERYEHTEEIYCHACGYPITVYGHMEYGTFSADVEEAWLCDNCGFDNCEG